MGFLFEAVTVWQAIVIALGVVLVVWFVPWPMDRHVPPHDHWGEYVTNGRFDEWCESNVDDRREFFERIFELEADSRRPWWKRLLRQWAGE